MRAGVGAAVVALTIAVAAAACIPPTGARAATSSAPTSSLGTGTQPVAPSPSGSNLVRIDGHARSVETTAPLPGGASVHLAGSSVLSASADVTDHAGHHLGTGGLKAIGSDLVVTGPGIAVLGRVRLQPGQVTLNDGSAGSTTLNLPGPTTIAAGTITFQPPAPAVTSTANPPVTAAPPTAAPPTVTLVGPVTVTAATVQVSGASLRYVNAPVDLALTAAEADLSWAGSGSITTETGPLQAPFLGVRAQQLKVTVHRGSATVDVRGTGLALQAFANGVPRLATSATVEILSNQATTGFLGRRRAFVWTPRNLGPTYDMAILRIRPANAAAQSVHIGLLPMPPMFGGEPHALVGGDTGGLKGGAAIDSLIARHGDDKRSIGYDAPPGVELVLVLEGNFTPVTVTVTTI